MSAFVVYIEGDMIRIKPMYASLFCAVTELDIRNTLARFSDLHACDQSFTLRQVAENVAGITYPIAFGWAQEGIITPVSGRRGPGRGREMKFNFGEAFIAYVLAVLRNANVERPQLRKAARLLRRNGCITLR